MATPVAVPTSTPGPAATPTPVETVAISFDSLKGLTESHGRGLDGTILFGFTGEAHPPSTAEELSARGSAFVPWPTVQRGIRVTDGQIQAAKLSACRQAVLAAMVTFQERAKREGANGVTDVRTFAEGFVSSPTRDKCLCRIGARAYTTVKGRLVKIEK
jgi:hypothetical protein